MYLTMYDKSPEICRKLLEEYTVDCTHEIANKLQLLIEKVLIPLNDEELKNRIYEKLSKMKHHINIEIPSNKYVIAWFKMNKPEIAERLITGIKNKNEKARINCHHSYGSCKRILASKYPG